MSKVYVTEYATMAIVVNGMVAQVPMEPPLAEQVVDYSGGVASSNAFNAKTKLVRIHTDAICSILFGASPTATTSTGRLAANQTEYRGVDPRNSLKVSAITNT